MLSHKVWTDRTLRITYCNSSSSLQYVCCACWYCNNVKIFCAAPEDSLKILTCKIKRGKNIPVITSADCLDVKFWPLSSCVDICSVASSSSSWPAPLSCSQKPLTLTAAPQTHTDIHRERLNLWTHASFCFWPYLKVIQKYQQVERLIFTRRYSEGNKKTKRAR